jgi:rubrerythrin
MSHPESFTEILDFAIAMELKAENLYTMIAEKATTEHNRTLFESLAQEEKWHRAKLEGVKLGDFKIGSTDPVPDLKISDYANDVEITDNSSYQTILMFAMKQEKQAFRMYTDLAEKTDNEELKNLFLSLAQEEAKHKLRFEIEYDEYVLREN